MADQKIETISWTSPEYIQKERSMDWFWTIGLISVLGAIAAIYFGNYMFAILILLSGGMFFLLSIHTPKDVPYELSDDGLKAGDKVYKLKELKFFDFQKDKESTKLLIQTDGKFMPLLTIIIDPYMKDTFEKELSKVVERKEMEESFSLKVMDMLGF
ncbi:MAG: hypothetical protein KBD48_02955 [Candidatus Pacebacteria bacterium]|nr:hypothetical protein [Candidatus Paceibacterota bacterium]MBP9716120.1 hypothetical protein [Candidatus Paceibacterota bacterium]